MLNTKNIDRALAQYADIDDAAVAESLTVFGALLKAAADLSAGLEQAEPEWSKEELQQAIEGKQALLSLGRLTIDREAFERGLKHLAAVYEQAAELDDEGRALCAQVDWSDYATESLMAVAQTDPMAYLQAVETLSPDENLLDLYILPIVGFTLRAFLDATATAASKELDAVIPDTVHIERSLTCPVCGSGAAVAAVVETMRNGNIKKLYCTCCGANWKFERIRCAVCGDEAVSDLTYVHDDKDDKHRLHVCKACQSAMPTVFAGDEMRFCPDVESIVMSSLEEFFLAKQAAENTQS